MSGTQVYNGMFGRAILTAACLLLPSTAIADTIVFQQGVGGYTRAQDTSIRWAYTQNYGDYFGMDTDRPGDAGAYEMWSTNGGATTVLEAGQFYQRRLGSLIGGGAASLEAGPTFRYSRILMRFRDVIGTAVGQIDPDAVVTQATLRLYNTLDLGAVVAAGDAALPDVIYGGFGPTTDPNSFLDNTERGVPRLNAGLMGIYPLLKSVKYGNSDGTAAKGESTGRSRRRGKEYWSQRCHGELAPNDPFAITHNCGPADVGDPHSTSGQEEYDSQHPGSIEVAQDASEGFKDFDVTGLFEFITGDGIFITGISPPDELPTVDLNYGQAYRSGEFGGVDAAEPQIATRPMLIVEFGSGMTGGAGDANLDGAVDVADLGIVGANYNMTGATFGNGDFSGDGIVDIVDLGILGANWDSADTLYDSGYLDPGLVALVPEPTSLLVLLVTSSLVLLRRFERSGAGV